MLGMKVVVSQNIKPVPRLQLSHDFTACSDACRAEMNAWLLARFGTYRPAYRIGDDTIVVSPEHYAMLRAGKGEG